MMILTQSGFSKARACPKAYKLRYIDGWESKERYGSFDVGNQWDALMNELALHGETPALNMAADIEDAVMRSKMMGMLAAYIALAGPIPCSGVQLSFQHPLINPSTGRRGREVFVAGKIDGLHYDQESQTWWIVEHKTSSGITPGYITRLSLDLQVHVYRHYAALTFGIDIDGVIYDAIMKPTIKLTKNETPEDYTARLVQWYMDNRDNAFYRERLMLQDRDIEEQCWMYYQEILWRRRNDYWPRNSSTCCNYYGRKCGYFGYCDSGDNQIVLEMHYVKKPINEELKINGGG